MFGSEARIGLTSSSLPNETQSEADLFQVFENNSEAEDITLQLSPMVLTAIQPRLHSTNTVSIA